MDMALNKMAPTVAAPAPAPATIPVALTGWSPSTIAELEAAGVSEVSVDPREPVYVLARLCPCASLHPSLRRSPCVWLHLPRPYPCPCARPPQRHGTPPSTATSQRRQLLSTHASPIDRAST